MRELLLVEDDQIVALDTTGALRDAGYGVEHASDAAAAVEALTNRWFDALITDVNLGPGADGFSVAQRWRSLHPDKPVIFLTGEGPAACKMAGVSQSEWMGKPFDCQRLVAALHLALGQRRAARLS